ELPPHAGCLEVAVDCAVEEFDCGCKTSKTRASILLCCARPTRVELLRVRRAVPSVLTRQPPFDPAFRLAYHRARQRKTTVSFEYRSTNSRMGHRPVEYKFVAHPCEHPD